MQIIFNQRKLELENSLNIEELLKQQEFQQSCFAVMLNSKFVAKDSYASIFLNDNDSVVTIQPMQGG
ncbi:MULTISPECIES: sulfur carrier protein ThiS [unclassified Francisella]|uniref:sulfur carrier protein ThiS n=1 Tax=unclassified Francisella TaxID=2610885 RepID=UPI002E314C5F|nr:MULTISPECIES: sulfur carrier protein ThiS [unclassified Francisella]MED7819863.1 sulfur carrier protein ThiS [Francisella sp. 19S2-4]MED7830673.1 sulfur carrier protein ThiS [Francisella sp. 19S2-10]